MEYYTRAARLSEDPVEPDRKKANAKNDLATCNMSGPLHHIPNQMLKSFAGCGKTTGCDRVPAEPVPIDVAVAQASVEAALSEVVSALGQTTWNTINDAHLGQFIIQNGLELGSLSPFKCTVLACAGYHEVRSGGEAFDYGDILELTDRFQSKAMNTTTIYKTISALKDEGLVASQGRDHSTGGRPTDQFVLTDNGRTALRLAAAMHVHLKNSRESAAA